MLSLDVADGQDVPTPIRKKPRHAGPFTVRRRGLEPPRGKFPHKALNLGCLPVVVVAAYALGVATRRQSEAEREAERVRAERIGRNAERPMSENLRDGIALSHQLLAFVGAARRT